MIKDILAPVFVLLAILGVSFILFVIKDTIVEEALEGLFAVFVLSCIGCVVLGGIAFWLFNLTTPICFIVSFILCFIINFGFFIWCIYDD